MAKRAARSARHGATPAIEPRIRDEVGAIAVVAFALLSAVALGFDQGALLHWWRSLLFDLLGWAAFGVPLVLAAVARCHRRPAPRNAHSRRHRHPLRPPRRRSRRTNADPPARRPLAAHRVPFGGAGSETVSTLRRPPGLRPDPHRAARCARGPYP